MVYSLEALLQDGACASCPYSGAANNPASTLLAVANAFRTSSMTPVYVAGFERVDVPSAD